MKLFYSIAFILLSMSVSMAQGLPSRPNIGELPIGKVLTWQTDGHPAQFFVQRSTDGIYYKTIGKVAFQDSLKSKFYTYLDASIAPDEVYYRIAQAGHDTGIQYSEASYFCSNAPNNLVLKRISDSQVEKLVIVEFESAENGEGEYYITTEIQNHLFTVYEKPFPIFRGKNVLPIQVQFLDPGFYQVHMTMDDEVEKFSFVKKQSHADGDVIVVKK